MGRAVIDFWINPTFRNYDEINVIFFGVVLCVGAVVGSLVSIFVIAAAAYCTLHLATGRLRWALPTPVNIVFGAFCTYFFAEAIAALANPSMIAFREVGANLPFLGLAGLYSVTFVDRRQLLAAVEIISLVASIATLALLLLLLDGESRPSLAAGNANVLALLGGLL